MKRLARYRQIQSKQTKKTNLDYVLLGVVMLLSLIGLIMVYDSSVVQAFQDFGDKYYYIKQQLIWFVLGYGALWFFSVVDYKILKRFAFPIFLTSFILVLAVFIPGLGVVAGGAHRWLRIGAFTIQPTEIIKLTSIIFFATLFERKDKTALFILSLAVVTFIIGILQKDLGSAIVYFATSILMYIMSGANLFYLFISAPLSLLAFLGFVLTSTYRKERILAFLNPFSDPKGYSYHISQVLIALGSGGITGVGLGQSRQKYEYIPEVTTDSIFAIVGEEFGFLGAVVLIILVAFLIFRGLKISENAPDNFGRLLGFGLTAWLGVQAALNLAAMVALVPLTGVPLPFISYGGSALLANLVAVGILLNISRSSRI